MTDYKEKQKPRSRVKSSSYKSFIIFLSVAVLVTIGFYFYLKHTTSDPLQREAAPLSQTQDIQNLDTSRRNQEGLAKTEEALQTPAQKNGDYDAATRTNGELPQSGDFSADRKTTSAGANTYSETDTDAEQLIAQINDFYKKLDSRTYMKRYNLAEPSKEYFSKLIQKLVNNPPVVSRETDDLFTLLKNTAHFFRILGKENILILKGILDREKESFEQVLQSFYSLTKYPEFLAKEYSLTIPPESLYDYAGFFLTTMGGRLYLFRRDSTSRMTVSFYAILIIDRFKDAGSDRHGLDLQQPINSLIDEIENAGKRLRLKNEYLDTLYDLKVKYSR